VPTQEEVHEFVALSRALGTGVRAVSRATASGTRGFGVSLGAGAAEVRPTCERRNQGRDAQARPVRLMGLEIRGRVGQDTQYRALNESAPWLVPSSGA